MVLLGPYVTLLVVILRSLKELKESFPSKITFLKEIVCRVEFTLRDVIHL